jgi:hypothetical protein
MLTIELRMLKNVGLDEEGNEYDEEKIQAKKLAKEKKLALKAKKVEKKVEPVYLPDADQIASEFLPVKIYYKPLAKMTN